MITIFFIPKKYKGILYIIISAFCFSLMNIFVRLSGDLPSMEKSFFRNLVALIFAFILIKRTNTSLRVNKSNFPALLIRSIVGTVGIFCNFYAIDHMLVSDASILNKLSPFFVIIFSFFILKERVSFWQGFFVITAFIGTIFIVKPGFSNVSVVPALIAVLGGMAAGCAYTFVRKLGNNGVKGPIIVFYFSSISCVASIPFMMFDFKAISFIQLITLLGAGLAAAGGQFSITAAYTYAPAKEISIYDYSQIIFITFLSFLILGEVPDVYSFIGYGVICIASIAMFIYNNKRAKKTL